MSELLDADARALQLVADLLLLSEANEVLDDDAVRAAFSAVIQVAVAESDPEMLVTALASHVIALLAILRPDSPESALEDLKTLATINRHEIDDRGTE